MDTHAFDLQEIKRVGQSFYVSLILATDFVINLSFVIINGNLLKQVAVTAKLFQ